MDLKGLSRFFTTGRGVSGNKHDSTIGEIGTDEIGEWFLPRRYQTLIDYTALQTAALATFPTFYLDDDSSSIAGYSPTEVVPGLPFVGAKYAKGPSGSHVVLTLTALPIAFRNTTTTLWATLPLLTFPFGRQTIIGGSCSLSFDWNYQTWLQASGTAVVKTTAAGSFAMGSAPSTSTTLTSTIVDLVASTALGTVAAGKSPANTFFVGPTAFDWSTSALTATKKNLNLSVAVTTGQASASMQIVPVTGTITFDIAYHGDYTAT